MIKFDVFRCRVLMLLALVCSYSAPALSWNDFNHVLIGDLALSQLEPKLQRKFESMAYSLERQLPDEKRLYLLRNFPDSSSLGHLSVFSDIVKRQSFADVFLQYGSPLSAEQQAIVNEWGKEHTADWHYFNQIVNASDNNKHCDISQSENYVSALTMLFDLYPSMETKANRAIVLAYIIHLVGDAHQPMHNMTRITSNKFCDHDRGGNRFCTIYSGNRGVCSRSLHFDWDRAMMLFNSKDEVPDAVDLISRVPVSATDVSNVDPVVWAKEGFRHAPFVYSLPQGNEPDESYVDEAQRISMTAMALAAARLSAILKTL